jgi:hypothetical protein
MSNPNFKENITPAERELLKRARAVQKKKGIEGTLFISSRPDKKLALLVASGNAIHFGDKNSETYIERKRLSDFWTKKRNAYIARHSKIILKDGTRAIDKHYSPSWLSFHILWDG